MWQQIKSDWVWALWAVVVFAGWGVMLGLA